MRVRSLAYLILSAVFTALLAAVTVRFALTGGEIFETVLLAGLTLLLALQTRRWYRRFRTVQN
jgi:hypothetical protein